MVYPLTDLNGWPLRDNGEPIFQTANDAMFYAQLIYDLPEKRDLLDAYIHRTHGLLQYERGSIDPDWDRLMELAVRAQFFRECLEECKRIEQEKLNNGQVQEPQ